MAVPLPPGMPKPEADKRRIFAGHPLFQHLEPHEIDGLLGHARVERREANETIFRKGDPALGMTAILKGRVKITAPSADGRDVLLNIIKPGEVFGEIAMLDGKARTADAVTMTPCDLLVIDRRDFLPFLAKHPELCLRLMAVLCERLRQTSEQVEDLMFLNLEARLAKALLRLAEAHGTPTRAGIEIGLKLSQRELGAIAGVSREGINRQLRDWQNQRIVAIEHGAITIQTPDALARIAEA